MHNFNYAHVLDRKATFFFLIAQILVQKPFSFLEWKQKSKQHYFKQFFCPVLDEYYLI